MKSFELVYKSGPAGDQCSTYDIKFNKEITVAQFLSELPEDEWGDVTLIVPDPVTFNLEYAMEHERYMKIHIEYNCGYLKHKLSDTARQYLNCVIKNGTANGGWSCMDYWLSLNLNSHEN